MAKKNIKKQKSFGENFFMVLGAIFILAAIFALPMITVWASDNGIDQTEYANNQHYYVNPLTPWSAATTYISADGSADTANESIPNTSIRYGADGSEASATKDNFQVSVEKYAEQAVDTDSNAFIENQFDITLQVTTNQEVQSLTEPQPASVVLTVDLSGSMQNENELTAARNNGKEFSLSNTDYDASRSQVDNLRAALRAFVTEFHAGDVDRYVSFVGYNGFAYPITHADYTVADGGIQHYNIGTNQVWYNLSNETDRNNAYAAINQIQELKYYGSDLADGENSDTRSAEDKNSAPERRYLVTYNKQDTIDKVYYVDNTAYTFNPTDNANAIPQTLAYFLGEVDAFDGKLEAVSLDTFKILIAQPGTVYHNSYNDIADKNGVPATNTSGNTFSEGGFIVANSLYQYAEKSQIDNIDTFNSIEDKNIIYFADGNANKSATGNYASLDKLNDFDYTLDGELRELGKTAGASNASGLANIQAVAGKISKDEDKQGNDIDITTILYETYDSSTQNNWLDKVQTRGYHVADSDIAGSLASVFAAILSNLTSGGTPWTVEDPMADYIDFVDFIAPEAVYATLFGATIADDDNNTTEMAYVNANDKLTWDLAKVAAAITSLDEDVKEDFYVYDETAGTHTYTLKYTATLDAHYKATEAVAEGKVSSLVDGKFYPTNEQTTLYYVNSEKLESNDTSTTTITGANGQLVDGQFEPANGVAADAAFMAYTQDFNVPTVKALVSALSFEKTNETGTKGLAGAEFSLWRYVGSSANPAEDATEANWLQVGVAGAWKSDANGIVSIPNLGKGVYRLQEVTAPTITNDGSVILSYELDETPVYFEIAWGNIDYTNFPDVNTSKDGIQFPNTPEISAQEHQVTKTWSYNEMPLTADELAALEISTLTIHLYNMEHVNLVEATDEDAIPTVESIKEDPETGEAYKPVGTATLTKENGWQTNFVDDNGNTMFDSQTADGTAIEYIIYEPDVPSGYTVSYNGQGTANNTDGSSYITHSLNNDMAEQLISLTVTKTWLAPSDEIVHPDIRIQLYRQAGEMVTAEEVTGQIVDLDGTTLTGTFSNLPKTDKYGNAYTYSIEEFAIDENGDLIVDENGNPTTLSGYEYQPDVDSINLATADEITQGFAITNALTPVTTALSGSKTWLPSDIVIAADVQVTVTLTSSVGLPADYQASKVLSNANGWDYEFTGLPLYTFDRDEEDYITGYEEIEYTISESITAGQASLDALGTWYAPIASTATDDAPTDINITNALQGNVTITLNKDWLAENGNPTTTYTVYQNNAIYEDGDGNAVAYAPSGIADIADHNLGTFPQYDTLGNAYTYDVREVIADEDDSDDIAYYMVSKASTDANGDDYQAGEDLIVSFANNTYNPNDATIQISGIKIWDQPTDITSNPTVTINLSSNHLDSEGQDLHAASIELDGTKDDNGEQAAWSYIFKDLPKFYEENVMVQSVDGEGNPLFEEDGTTPKMEETGEVTKTQISYTITETFANADGLYTTTYLAGEDKEVTIDNEGITESATVNINNYRNNTESVSLTVNKSWDWVEGVKLPDSVTFELLVQVAGATEGTYDYLTPAEAGINVAESSITVNKNKYQDDKLNGNSSALATFSDLPKYDDNHQPITYTVKEVKTNKYTSSVTLGERDADGNQQANIINVINEVYSPISVAKRWFKPEEIPTTDVIFDLYQDGILVATVDFAADVTYKENKDRTNYKAFRPAADGDQFGYDEAKGGWPEYDMENDRLYEYTIIERDIVDENGKFIFLSTAPSELMIKLYGEELGTEVAGKVAKFGKNIIKNTYIIETKNLTATKVWRGPEGATFPTVDFTLYRSTEADYANGVAVPSPSGAGDYTINIPAGTESLAKVKFEDLPVYDEDMQLYYYYIMESDVDGYSRLHAYPGEEEFNLEEYNPMRLVNVINQARISIEVEKAFTGTPAAGQTHPESITVELLQGSEVIEEAVIDIDPTTLTGSVTFDNLRKYFLGNGQLRDYTIREKGASDVNGSIYFTVDENQVYTVEYAQPQMDLDGISYNATITNSYANYLYQITRHYVAIVDGQTVVDTFTSDEVINIMHQNMPTMTVNGVVDAGDAYINGHTNFTSGNYTYDYIYQPAQGNREVELVSPGVLYEIDLYYLYTYTSDDPIRNPDPPGPTPGPGPEPTPDPEPTPTIVDIAEDETPLANIPAPIPVATVIDMPEEVLIIEDEVPLGNLPQTGSIGITFNVLLGLALLMFSVSGLMFSRKAR